MAHFNIKSIESIREICKIVAIFWKIHIQFTKTLFFFVGINSRKKCENMTDGHSCIYEFEFVFLYLRLYLPIIYIVSLTLWNSHSLEMPNDIKNEYKL